ncbi:hypothetical protein HY640_04385 [Candidatus Woesearchaeota archaeon]|nr:hypothetical protein [Candidatus Woesearchaeota archaeon]
MTLILDTGNAILGSLQLLFNNFVLSLPNMVSGLLVILIGYIVGMAFGFLVQKLFEHGGVDEYMRKAGVAHSIGFLNVSHLAGGLMKWYVFALFLAHASSLMDLGIISELLFRLARWVPDMIVAIIILLVGLVIVDYIADRMLHAKRKGVRLISTAVRWLLLLFVGITVLKQVGVDVSLAEGTTLILVAGIALGTAVALGIGFGVALKDEAKSIFKNLKKVV